MRMLTQANSHLTSRAGDPRTGRRGFGPSLMTGRFYGRGWLLTPRAPDNDRGHVTAGRSRLAAVPTASRTLTGRRAVHNLIVTVLPMTHASALDTYGAASSEPARWR